MIIVKYTEYLATSCGKIVGKKGKLISPIKKKNGYLYFSNSGGFGNPRQTAVHRFVWEYFYGAIPKHLHVDHINGDREDNRLDNLQLLTPADNTKKALCKLGQQELLEIRDLLKVMRGRDVANMYNVSEQLISHIKTGRKYYEFEC